jgi:hypothetical protein
MGSEVEDITPADDLRPETMSMPVRGGTLQSLGVDLYSNLGKVFGEFIANAHDSDATYIDIAVDFAALAEAVPKARQKAKEQQARRAEEAKAGGAVSDAEPVEDQRFDVLKAMLDPSLTITIRDDGHGMTWKEVQERYLPVNKHRRKDASGRETLLRSPGGRMLMGRKGVGKLAAFGVGHVMRLRTKRAGEAYATTISVDIREMDTNASIGDIPVMVDYEDGQPIEDRGTSITLSHLRVDAVTQREDTVRSTIQKRFFGIFPEEFAIKINGETLPRYVPDYEFIYPEHLTLKDIQEGAVEEDGYDVPEIGRLGVDYFVGFRRRKDHSRESDFGARIYANRRQAAGPSLFGLPSGMHSFHSADYMEAFFIADDLDTGSVDFISTDRSDLKEGNEVVGALYDKIREVLTKAIAGHARFKRKKAEEDIQTDPSARRLYEVINQLSPSARKSGKKLILALGEQFDVDSPEFVELSGNMINSMNANEVLIRLIEMKSAPQTIAKVASELAELAKIEQRDAIKLYQGRRDGILSLQSLTRKGEEDDWNKRQSEAELHALLKAQPWLIKPEYSLTRYFVSDRQINRTASAMAKQLGVDEFAPIRQDDGKEDDTRPDLTFVMCDVEHGAPLTVHVVELKSPSKALDKDHWDQLDRYIFRLSEWCKAELDREPVITGWLIGAMPPSDAKAEKQRLLLREIRESGARAPIRVVGLHQLIADAYSTHIEAIRAMTHDLADEEDVDLDEGEDGQQAA